MDDKVKIEIDARINALSAQRNAALNEVVVLVGQCEVFKARVKELEDKYESHSLPQVSPSSLGPREVPVEPIGEPG